MIRRALWVLLGIAATAGAAHAHNMQLAYQIQPGWRVQVRGWYEGGDPASGARVSVVRADGQTVSNGRLDKYGIFYFVYSEAKDMRIIVSVAGHRAEETIPAEALTRHIAAVCVGCLTPEPFQTAALLESLSPAAESIGHVESIAGSTSSFPMMGVLTGLGALLAVAILFKWLASRRAASRRVYPGGMSGGHKAHRSPDG